jgi:hypothetical protein
MGLWEGWTKYKWYLIPGKRLEDFIAFMRILVIMADRIRVEIMSVGKEI